MDNGLKAVLDMRVDKVIKNLEKRNMKGYHVKSRDELFALLSELVPAGATVANGGSMTLEELGVFSWLREREDITFFDRETGDRRKCMVAAFDSDVYFAGTNAVTEDGCLYNVDGNGNRVAALCFGPKEVLVIVGANKIVKDIKAAEERVKKIAAPKNCQRLALPSPCSKTGECVSLSLENRELCDGCATESRICSSYVISGYQRNKDRIKVIICKESMGY